MKGKTVIFLGSSVTYGSASGGVSFADMLSQTDGVNMIKEAVSGTTLADINEKSYISRMKKLDKDIRADAFVCQLSTNDATKNIPIGEIADSRDINDFDTSTVAGAIEYIIAYAKELFACPVIFYTQAKYDSEAYEKMRELLFEMKDKWGVHIIDLWTDDGINSITDDERQRYMKDKIHPTRDGYEALWLPKFREELKRIL